MNPEEYRNAMGEPVKTMPMKEMDPVGGAPNQPVLNEAAIRDQTAAQLLQQQQDQETQARQKQAQEEGVAKAQAIDASKQDQLRQEIAAKQNEAQLARLNMTASALQDVRNYGTIRPEIAAQLKALGTTAGDVDTLYKTTATIDPYEARNKAAKSNYDNAEVQMKMKGQSMMQRGLESGDTDLFESGLKMIDSKKYDEHRAAVANLLKSTAETAKERANTVDILTKHQDDELSKQTLGTQTLIELNAKDPRQAQAMYQILKPSFGSDAPDQLDPTWLAAKHVTALSATNEASRQKQFIERASQLGAPGFAPEQGTVEQSVRGVGNVVGDVGRSLSSAMGGKQVDVAPSANQNVVKPPETPNIESNVLPKELQGLTTKSGAAVSARDVKDLVMKAKQMGNDNFTEEDAKRVLIKHLGKK